MGSVVSVREENFRAVVTRAPRCLPNSRPLPQQALHPKHPLGQSYPYPARNFLALFSPPQVPWGRAGTQVGSFTYRLRQSASRSPGTGTPSAPPGAGKGVAAAAAQPWRAARRPQAALRSPCAPAPLPHSARSRAPRCLYIQSGGCGRAPLPAGGARAQRIGLGLSGAAADPGLRRGSQGGGARLC